MKEQKIEKNEEWKVNLNYKIISPAIPLLRGVWCGGVKNMFHKHKFQKDGLNLWCECGAIKKLECSHKWKVHATCCNADIEKIKSGEKETYEKIATQYNCEQILQFLICEVCGKIKSVNLTTGAVQDEDNYINVKYN